MTTMVSHRNFIPLPEDELQIIHGPIKPAEVYSIDGVSAQLSFLGNHTNQWTTLPVYRLSPLGIEIEVSALKISPDLSTGDRVDLILDIGNVKTQFNGLVVKTKHKEGTRDLIGIRWVQEEGESGKFEEKRNNRRWLCGQEFLPTGIAANPTRFNDYIYFKIRDFSKEGFQLTTSLRNKYLIKGMILDSTVSFPMVGQVQVFLRIENCRITMLDSKEILSIGTTMIDSDLTVLETIGQYILQFSPKSTVQELKKDGLPVKSASQAFEFGFVKTAEDYREVLSLRTKSYGSVGKMDSSAPVENAGDIFDTRAKILTVRHYGRIVGSMRTVFHAPEDQMEHEQFLQLPDDFPAKHDIAEVTRICTDPDYRGSDLFYTIIKQMVLIAAQAKRRYILGSATPKLLPMYLKVGFLALDIKYTHENLGNEEHVLMIIDVPKLLTGTGISPHMWSYLYSDMTSHLNSHHGVPITPLENLRLSFLRKIAPVCKFVSRQIIGKGKIQKK